jgi:nucleoside-diphosphate-sugar epimerase
LFRQAAVSDKDYYVVHVDGTRNVMESCLKHKIGRVVHCSTVGVHGDVENPPADENAPFNPGDMYQQTKLEGEKVALSFYETHGLPVSIIRPAMIYGPGDLRWLKFIHMTQAGLTFVPGAGENKLHLVHIDDLVSAFLLASEKREAIGEVFIIAGEKDIRLKDLLDLVARQSNKSVYRIHLPYGPLYVLSAICEKLFVPLKIEPPLYRRRLAFFKNCRSFNIEKARRVLGYAPTVSLEDGFNECISWFKKEGMINGRE